MQFMAEGGWFMWVVLFAGIFATLFAVFAAIMAFGGSPRGRAIGLSLTALLAAIAVPAIGGVGYALAMREIFSAVAVVDPSSRAQILAQGISEAMNNVVFGGMCGALPFIISLVALARSIFLPSPTQVGARGD